MASTGGKFWANFERDAAGKNERTARRATAHNKDTVPPHNDINNRHRNRDVNDPGGVRGPYSRAGLGVFTSRFRTCAVGTAIQGRHRPPPQGARAVARLTA